MAKEYGSPTGVEPPKNQGRPKAKAASDAQVRAAYEAHMKQAHEQFLAQQRQKSVAKPPRVKSQNGQKTSMPLLDKIIEDQSK